MPKLSQEQIDTQLQPLTGWAQHDDEIRKQWQFEDFTESMAFVNAVAELAEAANHHPDILIRYNQVTLTLSTHSEGGLTQADIDLAGEIESSQTR